MNVHDSQVEINLVVHFTSDELKEMKKEVGDIELSLQRHNEVFALAKAKFKRETSPLLEQKEKLMYEINQGEGRRIVNVRPSWRLYENEVVFFDLETDEELHRRELTDTERGQLMKGMPMDFSGSAKQDSGATVIEAEDVTDEEDEDLGWDEDPKESETSDLPSDLKQLPEWKGGEGDEN